MADCKTCKFHALRPAINGELQEVCRRNPPTVHVQMIPIGPGNIHVTEHTAWPQLKDGDVCGEHAVDLAVVN